MTTRGSLSNSKLNTEELLQGQRPLIFTPELLAVSAIIKVVPIGGQFAATAGTMTLLVKNTEEEAA
jgi:hypothetical protein